MQVQGDGLPERPKKALKQFSTWKHKKERAKRGADNGSKKFKKVDSSFTNNRERKRLQEKMMIMMLTFMGLYASGCMCMQTDE